MNREEAIAKARELAAFHESVLIEQETLRELLAAAVTTEPHPLNGSWLPIPEMNRLRRIENAVRAFTGATHHPECPVLSWAPEDRRLRVCWCGFESLRSALEAPRDPDQPTHPDSAELERLRRLEREVAAFHIDHWDHTLSEDPTCRLCRADRPIQS